MGPGLEDDIEKSICVALAVVPRTFRNGFGGKGAHRRRMPHATMEMAVIVARFIGRTYTFYDGNEVIEKSDMEIFLAAELTAVPDDLAKTYANKLTLYSEPARNEIAARLTAVLTGKWQWVYKPSEFINLRPMFSLLRNNPKGSNE